MAWGGTPVFSVIADWSTVVIVQKFSVLPGCPFLVLWLKRAEFSVVLSMPVGISGLPASSGPSVECRREKEKPGSSPSGHPLDLEVSDWSVFSLHFNVFLGLFYI